MDRVKRPLPLPKALVVVMRPFQAFFRASSASGIVLLVATLLAMIWANSPWAELHHRVFGAEGALRVARFSLDAPVHWWIDDALMAIFFFLVGMEIKRELVVGELRTFRRAILPAIAALGGMLVPAAIFFAFNRHGAGRPGWGIPMATDIAFALGCIAVVRGRVPTSLAVFLTALAIFDDLGAILVIAVFYGQGVHWLWLAAGAAATLVLVLMNLFGVRSPLPYALVGIVLWYLVLRSGIHATIAGVVLGLTIPSRGVRHPREVIGEIEGEIDRLRAALQGEEDEDEGNAALREIEARLEDVQPPLNRLAHGLEAPVSFLIVPLFALANAGIALSHVGRHDLVSPVTLGVALGLLLGKPIGVFLFTVVAVKLGIAPRPEGSNLRQLFGISILAGIGFTMSLFISGLAFAANPELQDAAKLGIVAASTLSAVVGILVLRLGNASANEAV